MYWLAAIISLFPQRYVCNRLPASAIYTFPSVSCANPAVRNRNRIGHGYRNKEISAVESLQRAKHLFQQSILQAANLSLLSQWARYRAIDSLLGSQLLKATSSSPGRNLKNKFLPLARNQLMHEAARHYRRTGFLIKAWAKTDTLERLNALCRDIYEGRVKKGYEQQVKYQKTGCEVILDHNYNSVLLDILFENSLPRLMQEFVGSRAMLCYVNAVTSLSPGYMTDWHSDGHARIVHKILYYPTFDDEAEPCLQIIPGHIKPPWLSRSRIFSNRYSSRIETAISKKQMVRSSNDNFVVLNTWAMHRAFPVTNASGVFRLMYSFIDWFKDEEERRRTTELAGTVIRINDELVEHYRHRLASPSVT
jgi:hypothetical protein